MSNIQKDHGIVAEQSRLLHLPVSFFSIGMGLSGVTLAWKAAGQPTPAVIPFMLMLFTSLVRVVITSFYVVKLLRYPSAVMDELRHPVRLNFFLHFQSVCYYCQWLGRIMRRFHLDCGFVAP